MNFKSVPQMFCGGFTDFLQYITLYLCLSQFFADFKLCLPDLSYKYVMSLIFSQDFQKVLTLFPH